MAKGAEVLEMLIPAGGWFITGNEYEDIQFLECEPITKKQFTDGFAKCDAWFAAQEADAIVKKELAQAKLAVLGLTADDLKALGL